MTFIDGCMVTVNGHGFRMNCVHVRWMAIYGVMPPVVADDENRQLTVVEYQEVYHPARA